LAGRPGGSSERFVATTATVALMRNARAIVDSVAVIHKVIPRTEWVFLMTARTEQ